MLAFETGHFATLWRAMAERLGLEVDCVPGDWRHGVDPDAVAAELADDRDARDQGRLVVHNETSTGVTSRVAEVRAAIDAAGHPALLLVDTISSLGSIDYRHDEWGVDVTVGGSQKGLMLPPGLGFNAVSEKALAASRAGAAAALVLGLGSRCIAANATGFFPYTPATNLLYGLREALAMLRGGRAGRTCSRATRATPRRRARAVRGVGPRGAVRWTRASTVGVADRGRDARRPRRRRVAARDPRALRHVARRRASASSRAGSSASATSATSTT